MIYRYKYLPFSEGSLKTLSEGTIKFTCPTEFNDPFDCLPHYDTKNIDRIPKLRPDLFKAAGARRGLSPAQRLQETGKFIARLRNRIDDGTFARDLMAQVGVVTLSRNALSIPMWSHYADFHRGFLLEFRTPVLGSKRDLAAATSRLLPFPVIYSRERPHIQIGVELPNDLVHKVLLTKSIDWQYEEEERVIDHARRAGIYPYRRDEILCSVIAGIRTPKEYFEQLESLVAMLSKREIPHLKLYRANIVGGEYRLEVKGHPRLASK